VLKEKYGTGRGQERSNSPLIVKGPIMKKSLLTLAAIALVSGAAFAGEADPSGQFALQIQGERTRSEVNAEAVAAVQKGATAPSSAPATSKVQPVLASNADARAIRAEAAQAVRLGQIGYGEQGRI
jgi:hypothetical protein